MMKANAWKCLEGPFRNATTASTETILAPILAVAGLLGLVAKGTFLTPLQLGRARNGVPT